MLLNREGALPDAFEPGGAAKDSHGLSQSNGKAPCSSIPQSERRRELERVLEAGLVREHTQLWSLLVYLGNKSLGDGSGPLKEYTIGIEALNKPADYDPRLDPTVRVEVGKLRKKLQDFYQGPGAAHPVKLVIPKGGYLPVFVGDAALRAGSGTGRPALLWFAAGMLVLAVGLPLGLRMNGQVRDELTPEVKAFWAQHLAGQTPTLLVYGTPLFTKLGRSYYRDTRLNATSEENDRLHRVIAAVRPDEIRPAFSFTGVGEAEALFLLTRVLAPHRVRLEVQGASSLTWNSMKGKQVIILGGRKFNPIIPAVFQNPKFEAQPRRIVNLRPTGSEPVEYVTESRSPHGEILREYALISVYPGLSPSTRVVILDCSSTEGTLAAAEFLTRSENLRELVARRLPLVRAGERTRPYQVVIGAKFHNGVVVRLEYVTHAVLG